MNIRKCVKCEWTFEFTHSNQCPQCGSETEEHTELNQYSWFIFKRKRYEEALDRQGNKVQCCYTAKHTNGWHHDERCPERVMVD